MSDSPQPLEIKIGKRKWRLLTVRAAEPANEVVALVDGIEPDAVDLLLVSDADEPLQQRWNQWIEDRYGDRWVSRSLTTCEHEALAIKLAAGGLVIGPRGLAERFCEAVSHDHQEASVPDASTPSRRETRDQTPLALPDPGDIPPFPEEGHFDPFGLNRALKAAAWREVSQLVGRLAGIAHRHGLAVTLPSPPPGHADADLRPWRTVVSLEGTPADADEANLASVVGEEARFLSMGDSESGLDLLQRCLLIAASLHERAGVELDWQEVSTTLEHFGYLLISDATNIENYESLLGSFELGAFAARIHARSIIHGDMHPGNFGYHSGEPPPLGERLLTFDAGDMRILERPLTPRERAQDLAVLKSQCSFLQWEAAKLGYRFKAPEVADQVFELFEVRIWLPRS